MKKSIHMVKVHFEKHHRKYLLGALGSFAVVKMVVLFAGFLSIINLTNIFAANLDAGSICSQTLDITGTQCETLINLYNTTNGDSWTDHTNRGHTGNICNTWTGVSCQGNTVTLLELNNNNLVGSLPSLSGLVGLTTIDIGNNSGFIVNLSALENNCALSQLQLSERFNNTNNQPIVQGVLTNLSCMTGLTDIIFTQHGTTVSGDIALFATMPNLNEIYMNNSSQIYGDISVFAATPHLASLYMMTSNITGNISVFADTNDLSDIRIDTTNVHGDIGVFSHNNTPHLLGCTITNTRVSGDIAVFGTLTGIHYIYLNSTDVTGNLSSLSSITTITFGLMFQDTHVGGDIAALSGMTGIIYYLILNGPNIYGNLSSLSGLHTIRLLRIYNSHIEGTLDTLLSMTGLTDIELGHNNLTGDIPVGLMTHLPNVYGNISSNFLNTDSVTDPTFMDFLDSHLDRWREQTIYTDFGLTGTALTYSTGINTGFPITYTNSGRSISGAYIFVQDTSGIVLTGYAYSGYFGRVYGVPGDSCYDALMSNTSTGTYYAGLDNLFSSLAGVDFYTFASNPSMPGLVNYTGQRYETEGQWFLTHFCSTVVVANNFAECINAIGNSISTNLSLSTLAGSACGTGGTGGYFYSLPMVPAATTTTMMITGMVISGQLLSLPIYASLPANIIDTNQMNNYFVLSLSLFVPTPIITPPPLSPQNNGGTPTFLTDVQKGICLSGQDNSPSYYDNLCGPQQHNAAGFLIENPVAFNTEVARIKKIVGTEYTIEDIQGYIFARDIGITTTDDIIQADMSGKLIRSHMAKMIVTFATKVLNKTPDTSKKCTFSDMKYESTEMQGYAILACQLGLMGLKSNGTIPNKIFNPNTTVDRAQFGTILSRLLRGNTNNGGYPFYINHLQALKRAGIITTVSLPKTYEVRGQVFLMLMKAFGIK